MGASLKLRKYVFTKAWKVTVTASISENKLWAPCQNEKESQATISESSHVQWSFIQQKAHLYLRRLCNLDNTQNRPSSAWESFNIRQKLGLFVFRGLLCAYIESSYNITSNWYKWVVGSSTLVSRLGTWNIKFC